jgi:hypothetical protein
MNFKLQTCFFEYKTLLDSCTSKEHTHLSYADIILQMSLILLGEVPKLHAQIWEKKLTNQHRST